MTALQQTRTVSAEDTGEALRAPVLLDYHMNTGWDWMEEIDEKTGWHPVANWGSDGWDLGQWPYVIIVTAHVNYEGRLFWGLGTYCEGDVTTRWYKDRVERWEAIAREAFFYWKLGQSDGPPDLPDTAA